MLKGFTVIACILKNAEALDISTKQMEMLRWMMVMGEETSREEIRANISTCGENNRRRCNNMRMEDESEWTLKDRRNEPEVE